MTSPIPLTVFRSNSIKIWSDAIKNKPSWSQRNFAHITIVTLPWHLKFWSNFEFDWNIVSGTGACNGVLHIDMACLTKFQIAPLIMWICVTLVSFQSIYIYIYIYIIISGFAKSIWQKDIIAKMIIYIFNAIFNGNFGLIGLIFPNIFVITSLAGWILAKTAQI